MATINTQNVNVALETVLQLDGAIAAALVDCQSGMSLGSLTNNPAFAIDVAAAGNSEVIKAKQRVMDALGVRGGLEDILITLQEQYHLIRPLRTDRGLFFYLALSRAKGNLAMARHQLAKVEEALAA